MIRPCGRQGKEEDLEADDDEDGSETRPVRHGCGLGNSGKPGNIKYLNLISYVVMIDQVNLLV